MAREAFEAILAGIKDAGEHLRSGGAKGRRVHEVHVDEIDVAKIREDLELTQDEFAKMFCVNAGTIRNWEQDIRKPVGPARVLLNVIAKRPKAVLEALAEGPSEYARAKLKKKHPGRPKKKASEKKSA